MSDSRNIVTGFFVLAALLLSIAAYMVYPRNASTGMEEQVNKPLFEFEPKSVRGLTIVKYDQVKNRFDRIVMQNSLVNGWQIPSKSNYPVDSAEKLVYTAASLSGLIVLAVASEDPTDEETYGVVEPDSDLKAGQEGVGTKISLQDNSKQEIASVIIGKPVKDQPKNRFVRIPGQRFIYICEYDPSILETDFFAWINPKVLNWGQPWTVAQIAIDRYATTKAPVLEVKKTYQAVAALENNRWSVRSYLDAENPESKPNLDVAELERIRLALENFEIQDVVRKNAALAQSLKDRKGIPVTFGVMADIEKLGFYVDEKQDPNLELGAGGELSFTTDTGLRYDLRFGALKSAEISGLANDQRYVMLSASVDLAKFPKPVHPNEKKAGGTGGNKAGGNDAPKPPGNDCDPGFVQEDDDEREALRQYNLKMEAWNEKVGKTQVIANQINSRFSDWFYLIDEALYKRLVPARDAIVSKNQ